jgi:arginase
MRVVMRLLSVVPKKDEWMNITIVCVPYQIDVARWGFALGPQVFLDAGLVARLEAHGHHVSDPVWIELPREERTRDTVTNLGRIAARTSQAVTTALQQADGFAIVLEGDCTHSVGAIGGVARACGAPGVVWFDAHGDLHTFATTSTGFIGGMPYAVALGWDLQDWRQLAGLEQPVRAEAAALIGTSDLDREEATALDTHPIARLDADRFDDATGTTLQALLAPRASAADAWYVHLDVDVAGPDEVPGAMTPAPYWPARQHLLDAMHATVQAVPVRALALAAYNPAGDPERRGARLGLDALETALDGLQTRTSSM